MYYWNPEFSFAVAYFEGYCRFDSSVNEVVDKVCALGTRSGKDEVDDFET